MVVHPHQAHRPLGATYLPRNANLYTGVDAFLGRVPTPRQVDIGKTLRAKAEEGLWNVIGHAAARDRRTALGRMAVEETISRLGPYLTKQARSTSGRRRGVGSPHKKSRKRKTTRKKKVTRKTSRKRHKTSRRRRSHSRKRH